MNNDLCYCEYIKFVHKILAPLPGICSLLWKLFFVYIDFIFLLAILFWQLFYLFLCFCIELLKKKKKKISGYLAILVFVEVSGKSLSVSAIDRTLVAIERALAAFTTLFACLRSIACCSVWVHLDWQDGSAPVRPIASMLRSNTLAANCYIFTLTLNRTIPTLERTSAVSTNKPEVAQYNFLFFLFYYYLFLFVYFIYLFLIVYLLFLNFISFCLVYFMLNGYCFMWKNFAY